MEPDLRYGNSNHYNQLILDSVEEGILGLDSQGRHIFVNPAAARMLGYRPEELIGQPSHTLWHHSHVDGTPYAQEECPIRSTLTHGEPYHSDQEVFWRKNGTSFPVEYTATPIGQRDGTAATVLNFHDITRRRQAETALLAERATLDAIFDSSPVGMLVLDAQREIVRINAVAAALSAHSPAELLHKKPGGAFGCIHATDDPRGCGFSPSCKYCPIRNGLTQLLASGRPVRGVELAMDLTRDGATYRVWLRVGAESIVLGGNRHTILAMDNITDRKEVEQALRESEETLRTISASAQDAILMTDDEGRIVFWNDAAERVFGYRAAEAMGANLHDLLAAPQYHAAHRKAFAQFRVTGEGAALGKTLELEAVRKGGSQFPIEASLAPVKLHGRWHAVGIVRDISERKRAEEKLKSYVGALASANTALEELAVTADVATRAKSQFLANMSHEIRTPMTAVLGYTQILMRRSSDPQTLECLDVIHRNGEYLLRLLNDILDLSKIEAGKLTIEERRCAPAEIVAEVKSLMQVQADAKGIVLLVEYRGSIPSHIRTDPDRLRQILVNLVGNALKFTERGAVHVTVAMAQGEQPMLQFDIEDTGIGMTAEQAAGLFQPFCQGDESSTRRFGGTGLGLAISKRLAERLGWQLVLVSSQPGVGSQFRLVLPASELEFSSTTPPTMVRPVADQTAIASSATVARLDCRILLAEDGVDNQRLIAFLLEQAGAEVTAVEDGQMAVETALAMWESGWPYDVILMDMQMPVMDGYAATRQLRQAGYTGAILALTAHAMSSDRDKCLQAGCDDYLTKPIRQEALLSAIGQHAHAGRTPSTPTPGGYRNSP